MWPWSRVAELQSGEGRAPPHQLFERPRQTRRFPATDRDLAEAFGAQVVQDDAAIEQADFDRSELGCAVPFDVCLDLLGGMTFDQRHGRDGGAGQNNDGQRRNEALPHGSASGCREGCAASKAGCLMQVA